MKRWLTERGFAADAFQALVYLCASFYPLDGRTAYAKLFGQHSQGHTSRSAGKHLLLLLSSEGGRTPERLVANSERQVVDTAFRSIREAFEQTPFLKRLVTAGTINVLGDRVEFPSAGSTIQAFSAKALRDTRTKAVAGNAAHQIAEAAKITGWQIAQRFGALPIDQRRYWQTAGDERVRIAHAQVPGMNLAGVPLNQPFATPLGPCFLPPLEHGCRCKTTLRRGA